MQKVAGPQIARRAVRTHAAGLKTNPVLGFIAFCLFLALIVVLVIPPDLGASAADVDKDFGAPSATLRTIKFALMALSVLVIGSKLRLSVALFKSVNSLFVAYLFLIPVSIVWSVNSSATLARFVSLVTVVLVCFSVCLVGWSRLRLQQVCRPILTLFLLGSLMLGMIAPDWVLERGNDISLRDAWHGLASQKNEFGQLSSFGVIFWAHALLARQSKMILALIGIGIAATCLWLSRSSTGALATVFAIAVMLLLQRPPPALRRYMPYLVGSFTALALTYAIAVLNLIPGLGLLLEPFTVLSGKDMTFSNRVLIWDIIKEHIGLSPLLGSGYGAYWTGAVPSSPSYVFLSRMYLYPTQSHNGFLEVTNDLGFVGLFCLLGFLVVYVKQSIKLMLFDRVQASLYIAILFQQVIINLSESCWITARSASSDFMILATLALGRSLLEHRRQAVSSPARAR